MNRLGITGIIAAAILTFGVTSAAIAPTAQAAQVATSTVQVLTTRPGSLTIIGHQGQPVTVWTKGAQPITKRPSGTSPITFIGLAAGRAYSVYVGPTMAAVVRTTTTAGVISDVTVQGGPITSSLDVSWRVALASGTTVQGMRFLVAATSTQAPRVSVEVTGTQRAIITELRPDARYTITVTPIRGTSAGTAKTITMRATVAQAFATTSQSGASLLGAPVIPAPTMTPVSTPLAAPSSQRTDVPAATSTSVEPARPTTKTIYVCPTAYVEVGGRCQQNTPYTFHDQTVTSAYTYHQEFVQTGSHLNFSTSPNGGTYYAQDAWNRFDGSPAGYYAMEPEGYTVSVKDAPPAGYSDNGSQYSKTTQVRDALPSGYLDDGTQWLITTPMEARVVAA